MLPDRPRGGAAAGRARKLSTRRQRCRRIAAQPRHRAAEADAAAARRARLDRDEGPGEGPHPALRDGQRLRRGHPALPGRRAGGGPPAERRLPAAEVRPAAPGAGASRRAWCCCSCWPAWPARAWQAVRAIACRARRSGPDAREAERAEGERQAKQDAQAAAAGREDGQSRQAQKRLAQIEKGNDILRLDLRPTWTSAR